MLTDYSVLISESYDGQHSLLVEKLKRSGAKVHTCGETEIELEIGAIKYEPNVIVADCCRMGYEKLLAFREKLHSNGIRPIIYNIYTYDDAETIRILLDYEDIMHILMPYDAANICHYMLDKLRRRPIEPEKLRQLVSKEIHRTLNAVGISHKHTGYDHIFLMIYLLIFRYSCQKIHISQLYNDVKEHNGKSIASIERSTRNAIASGWEKMNTQDKQKLFENCYATDTRPTNSLYITTIAKYIMELYKDPLDIYFKNKKKNT